MPEYNDDGSVKTVRDMAAENPVASAKSFSELADDPDHKEPARYAVEDQDVSGFVGVSEEYRTYASDVDSPLDFDPSVADNSQEKLDALAEAGVDVPESSDADDSSADDSGDANATGSTNEQTTAKRPAAKKSEPPIKSPASTE